MHNIKLVHEKWVKETLKISDNKEINNKPQLLRRVTSGKELALILCDAYGTRFDYEENMNEENLEFIADAFQLFSDYVDIYSEMQIFQQIKANSDLSHIIKEVEQRGFFLFAEIHIENYNFFDGRSQKCPICTIAIKNQDNEEIIQFDSQQKTEEITNSTTSPTPKSSPSTHHPNHPTTI